MSSLLFQKRYPFLASWVNSGDNISIGGDYHYSSWVRLFDAGGLIFEVEDADDLDDALQKAEDYLKTDFSR